MDKFWPGPLTIIMHKSCIVPSIITAGLDTVAVRMPSHPVARALISESGLPIAAPSANTSGKPSPTAPKHVIDDLSGKVDIIIDSGFTKLGLESTVLDMTSNPPAILRPGGITLEQLEKVLPGIGIDPGLLAKEINNLAPISNISPRSPGMKYTHYSPKADVIVVEGELTRMAGRINQMIDEYKAQGANIGVLATEQTLTLYKDVEIICVGNRDEPETIAANLFGALREFDERNVEVIFAEAIENLGIGLAVMNRMNKAAGYNIIKV
jgi:L-threonylcarbamoyladenylate synthase